MDINLVTLSGTLAARPEVREYSSGVQLLRMLIRVRSEDPRPRLDILPVVLWEPSEELVAMAGDSRMDRGARVFVVARLERRFWQEEHGRESRVEIVATDVTVRGPDAVVLGSEG